MIYNAEDATKAVLAKHDVASSLKVTQVEGEPGYWLVTPTGDDGEGAVGGTAYVVDAAGNVCDTSAGLSPRARIEAARASMR